MFSGEAANASTNLIVFGLNLRGLEANTETLWVRDRVMFMVFNAKQYFSYIVEVSFIGGGETAW